MSICKGIAGLRGKQPIGIFIHNDAGSKNANAAFYSTWLQRHDLQSGFAHYYVGSDSILQAENDNYCAWHCGQNDGNRNYLSIEICQSKGDINTFISNEEKALVLAARKCKEYGITPTTSTIRLHQEVYATSCPHRSVEIHSGVNPAKEYFIQKITELMGQDVQLPPSSQGTGSSGTDTSGSTSEHNSAEEARINFKYKVFTADDGWLPEVINLNDFAGIRGHWIRNVAISVDTGTVKYRVHIKEKDWLPYVTGFNTSDHNNGYAGSGEVIDAVEIYYQTPVNYAARFGYQKAQYRVSPVNGDYWPWQYDNETINGQDGYAGCLGQPIDRLQLF